MNNYFEFNYFKKVSKINYIILTLFITLSIISHIIAFRLIEINNYSIFPSSFTYMACFVLVDVMASYNSRKFIILAIILEGVMNFLMLLITNLICQLPHPEYVNNTQAFIDVFTPIKYLFFANLLGSFIAFLFDSTIFYYLYKSKNYSFITSSIISSLAIILIYTVITDYYAFKLFYSDHIYELIITNIVTNLISIVVYAILSRWLVINIFNYLNK